MRQSRRRVAAGLVAGIVGGVLLATVGVAGLAAPPSGEPPSPAHTDDHRMPMVEPGPDAAAPTAAPLDRSGWTATASSESGDPSHVAAHVLDGRTNTIWHSSYAQRLPQAITLDTGAVRTATALVYTPRQDPERNGVAVGYEVTTSLDGRRWESATTGTWAGDSTLKTAAFAARALRFVRLSVTAENGRVGAFATAAELDVLGETLGAPLDRAGWRASARSSASGAGPERVLDDDPATAWRAAPGAALPHDLTLDLGAAQPVSAVWVTPDQAAGAPPPRGYEVAVGTASGGWRTVATGEWDAGDPGAAADRLATFVPTTTRRVRLRLTGTAAGLAEARLLGAPPTPVADRARAAATATSAAAGRPPALVLDGRTATSWRAAGAAGAVTRVAVDLGAPHALSGLRVTPGADDPAPRYLVQVSADGRSWRSVASGAWADTRSAQTVWFARTEARHVRLLPRTAGDEPATTASVAELEPLGEPTPGALAGRLGRWGDVVGFPLVPASAVLLPGNRVLGFSASSADMYDVDEPTRAYTQIAILDLDTGAVTQRRINETGHEMFCTGISLLADGRVLITGGSGPSNSTVYDPDADTWSRADQMELPRGYQSSTTLSDGRVFTLGGSWSGAQGGRDAEVFDPGAGGPGSWSRRTGIPATAILTDDTGGVFRADNHGWFFGWRDGTVFHAGPSDQMLWFDTAGAGTVSQAGERADGQDAMNGNAVMYDAGRILTVGGSPDYSGTWASGAASTIDVTGGPGQPVRSSATGSLRTPRTFANAVALPDGSVLVVGGQEFGSPFSDSLATRTPELWDPGSGQFRDLAPESIARTYHSAAVLLPDGRVWSGGGGLCAEPCSITTNHLDGQIFTPPYLLRPDGQPRTRPQITSAPARLTPGTVVEVRTATGAPPPTSFALVRYGSATHSVNTDQRRVALTPTRVGGASSGRYRLTIPPAGVVVPGDHLLFALDAAGTPSVAATVRVGVG